MPADIQTSASAEPSAYAHSWLRGLVVEHVVTVAAASLGVLVVALIAVLMGMA